ncbi:MAG: DUF2066 domain-containing protein [Gammaproteobacteria bacterium]
MRSVKTIAFILAVSLGFLPAGAFAANGLYAAASPVPNQSAQARAAALQKDLATVFVKVSGAPGADKLSSGAGASALVLEYRYQTLPSASGGGLALWARFDKKRVNAALASAGMPIWGENRPRVVAWVLGPAGLVGDDATNSVARALHQAAAQRGVPLVLPLMDIVDRQQVSGFDIKTFALAPIEKASQRYDAQAFLVGTIHQPRAKGGPVSSRWQFDLAGTSSPFPVTAPTPASVAAAAVGKAAGLLAAQFARTPGEGQTGLIALAVTGVDNLKTEASVRRYVAGVGGVKTLRLASVSGGVLNFMLNYTGSPQDFARQLSLSGFLTRDETVATPPLTSPAPATGSVPSAALTFRYTP